MGRGLLIYRKRRVKEAIESNVIDRVVILRLLCLRRNDLLSFKPHGHDDGDWVEHCKWVIHTILSNTLKRRNVYDKINIYSKYFERILGAGYRTYIDALLDNGIILTDNKFSKLKGKSYGFKLNPQYARCKIGHTTLTGTRLTKAILKHKEEQRQKLIERAVPLAPVTYWLTTKGLTMDKPDALDFLQSYKRLMEKQISGTNLSPDEQKAFVDMRYHHILHQIENFPSNSFSIDSSGGRLYSALTSLPSIFRNFISYDNKPLAYLDIRNSQPFHFLFLLSLKFWKSMTNKVLGVRNRNQTSIKSIDIEHITSLLTTTDQSISPYILFVKKPQNADIQNDTRLRFFQLVLSGKLYMFISEQFRGKFFNDNGLDRFETRSLAKGEFLHMMYHNPRECFSIQKPVFKEFKRLFPLEARLMEELKRADYRHFPVLLQGIEAWMLLKVIPRMIFYDNPDVPIFTIHDGIVVPESYQHHAAKLLEEAYMKELGVAPALEIKTLSWEHAYQNSRGHARSKIKQSGLKLHEPYPGLRRFIRE